MEYRVDELAGRAGVNVDTVRFYQTKGLLPPPERRGRLAWYDDDHLARLHRIKKLKSQGFSLSSIRSLLSGNLDPADGALVEAVAGQARRERRFSADEVARRTGVSGGLLEALERQGLLGETGDGERSYSSADVAAIEAGLELLEAGIPLDELLALAREHDAASRTIAARAVELFVQFVREPIRASAASEAEAATELVERFRRMVPATTSLVAAHFYRILMEAAESRIERVAAPENRGSTRAGTG